MKSNSYEVTFIDNISDTANELCAKYNELLETKYRRVDCLNGDDNNIINLAFDTIKVFRPYIEERCLLPEIDKHNITYHLNDDYDRSNGKEDKVAFISSATDKYKSTEAGSSTGRWHTDVGMNMIICSYPYPTQILLPKTHIGFDFILNRSWHDTFVRQPSFDNYIKSNDLEVLTPNPGDVYYLGPHVVHRTNENCYTNNAFRVMLRMWNVAIHPERYTHKKDYGIPLATP